MTVAIYERVSSRGQRLDSQHHDLATWASGQGSHGQALKWYTDKFTDKTMDRLAMAKLLGDLRAGKVKCVVVWRLDRPGRTAKGSPPQELGEFLVALRPEDEVPVVGHDAGSEQPCRVFVQGLSQDAVEGGVIAVFLEQGEPSHGAVERVIDQAARSSSDTTGHSPRIAVQQGPPQENK